jgi:hypothetical protein
MILVLIIVERLVLDSNLKLFYLHRQHWVPRLLRLSVSDSCFRLPIQYHHDNEHTLITVRRRALPGPSLRLPVPGLGQDSGIQVEELLRAGSVVLLTSHGSQQQAAAKNVGKS